MPVRRAQPNILTDLNLELIIYRILLLSPFEILRNQHIATTWRVKLYVYTSLFACAVLRVVFCILLVKSDKFHDFFLYNGPLWMLVDLFDYVFTALSVFCTIMNSLVTRKHQIKFYQELQNFDIKLAADFKIAVRRSRTRTINRWVLIASLIYCIGDFYNSWINYGPTISSSLKFTFLFTYYFSNILAFVSALQFVNCTQLCSERLVIIRKLLRSYSSNKRLDKILHLYGRICSQIFHINKFMGFVVLLKVAHDFTMGTSILFMMCSYDAEMVVYWMWFFGHTVIGTLMMTLVSGTLITEV